MRLIALAMVAAVSWWGLFLVYLAARHAIDWYSVAVVAISFCWVAVLALGTTGKHRL